MERADVLKAQQQAAEFIFPGEQTFDGAKALFEYGWIEQRFAAALAGFPSARIGVDAGYRSTL